MARYKLTITDLESGKIELEQPCDGIIGAIISQSADPASSPISFCSMSELSSVDSAALLMALDDEKNTFWQQNLL